MKVAKYVFLPILDKYMYLQTSFIHTFAEIANYMTTSKYVMQTTPNDHNDVTSFGLLSQFWYLTYFQNELWIRYGVQANSLLMTLNLISLFAFKRSLE